MREMNLERGYYFLSHPEEPEETLVFFYKNPDTQEDGFGFNAKDGGGFLPLNDLSPRSNLHKVIIVKT